MKEIQDFSYFPGCSLATTAAESNHSLKESARILGFNLVELEDWNCCGSSAAKSLSQDLCIALSGRNLSLAPAGRPLVVMCPRCLHQLRYAQMCLQKDPDTHRSLETHFGRPIPLDLEIVHILEVLVRYGLDRLKAKAIRRLDGLRYVPYYGCTLYRPPALMRKKYFQGEMENVLAALGAQAVPGGYMHRCCGSFLSATRPDIVSPLVNEITDSAVAVGAHCVVTACAMCQLNLEIRCTSKARLPVFHFSEILALALGAADYESWFARHLVDPKPLLQKLDLVA